MYLLLTLFSQKQRKETKRLSSSPQHHHHVDFTRVIPEDDPLLYEAQTEIIRRNQIVRTMPELGPRIHITETEWMLYRQRITSDFVSDLLFSNKKNLWRLVEIRFSKCIFTPGSFERLISRLSEQMENIHTFSITFDGYFNEQEQVIHPGRPFLPFSDLVRVAMNSSYRLHRISFTRSFLPQYKFSTLIRSVNSRETNNSTQFFHLTLHIEMENLMNRDSYVYDELHGVISNVQWDPYKHSMKDIQFIELQQEDGTVRYRSLSEYYKEAKTELSQTAVRIPKMDLEVSFAYCSEYEETKIIAKRSSNNGKEFLNEINILTKQLYEQEKKKLELVI